MSRIGTVRELDGKYAIISTSRRGICEGCSDKSSCSFDNALGKSVPELITTVNAIQAKPGDLVEFDLAGHTELKTSLIVWIIPLIGLILGAVTGSTYHDWFGWTVDSATLIGLGCGLALGFGLVIVYERYFVIRESVLPVLLRIMTDQPCQGER